MSSTAGAAATTGALGSAKIAVSSASVSRVPVGMPPDVNHCEPYCCDETPMPTDWRAAVRALMPSGEPGIVLIARCQMLEGSTSTPPTL